MTAEERPAAEVIEERLALFRAALEACAAEGFDPAEVTLIGYRIGVVGIHPAFPPVPGDRALALLRRLTDSDSDPFRTDLTNAEASSYLSGGVTVYAELHPDAPRNEDAASDPGPAR